MKLEQVYLNYYICVENDQNDIYFSIFKMKKNGDVRKDIWSEYPLKIGNIDDLRFKIFVSVNDKEKEDIMNIILYLRDRIVEYSLLE